MFSSARIFHLKIVCMNFVRTVGRVHIVIIPSITQFQSGKNLTVQAATVLLYCCTADTGDRQQTVSDNFKVTHPVVFCYN
jgi:hypothetical protein